MSKFATDRTFDEQRASLGRTVVVRFPGCDIEAGEIVSICDDDTLIIKGNRTGFKCTGFVAYVSAKTEESVNALPVDSWTWPVRV